MIEQETEQSKKHGVPQKVTLEEKLFTEDCKTRHVSPIILKTFRNAKIVSERGHSKSVLHLTQDHYKNMLKYVTENNRGYQEKTGKAKQQHSFQ